MKSRSPPNNVHKRPPYHFDAERQSGRDLRETYRKPLWDSSTDEICFPMRPHCQSQPRRELRLNHESLFEKRNKQHPKNHGQLENHGSKSEEEEEEGEESDMLLRPKTRPISHEQLVVEVKGIYAGLVMVEAECIDVDQRQAAAAQDKDPSKRFGLTNDQWQSLISLHKQLLHEHHDFFLASQHLSASPALGKLAPKYSMPARMWRHGNHAFWHACSNVSRFWCNKASEKNPNVHRLYHHLAILSRPYSWEQLSLYAKSLTCTIPFESARSSIKILFNSILSNKEFGIARTCEVFKKFTDDFAAISSFAALFDYGKTEHNTNSAKHTGSVLRGLYKEAMRTRRVPETGVSRPLAEDFVSQGQLSTQGYIPPKFFDDAIDEDELFPKLPSMNEAGAQKSVWPGNTVMAYDFLEPKMYLVQNILQVNKVSRWKASRSKTSRRLFRGMGTYGNSLLLLAMTDILATTEARTIPNNGSLRAWPPSPCARNSFSADVYAASKDRSTPHTEPKSNFWVPLIANGALLLADAPAWLLTAMLTGMVLSAGHIVARLYPQGPVWATYMATWSLAWPIIATDTSTAFELSLG